MVRNIREYALYVVFSFWLVMLATKVEAETWRITSLAWEPYSGSDIPKQGSSIDILRELLKQEGIELIVEFYPWKRAQMLAAKTGYVGYFPAWPEEVAEGFTASPAIDWSSIGVLKRSNQAISFDSINTLYEKYKVGTVSTYAYPKKITDAMMLFPQNVSGAPHEEALLKKLSTARTDVAITDPTVMMYLAGKYEITNVEPIEPILMKKQLVLAFNNADPENVKRLNRLNQILKGNQSVSQIVK